MSEAVDDASIRPTVIGLMVGDFMPQGDHGQPGGRE
jgi:hypothetical protein